MRNSTMNRIGLAAVVGCIAVGSLAIAGCGGGDDTSSTGASGASGASGGTPLSKEEFVSQANAICADANEQVQALSAPPQNASVQDVVPFLTQGLELAREFDAKLEALTPPPELQDDVDQLVAESNQELALAEKSITAAKAGDTSEFQALSQQIDALDKKGDQISNSIGLTECTKHVEAQG